LRVGFRGPPRLAAPLRARQALAAHQPRNLIATDTLAGALERTPHPPIPIRPVVGVVQLADPTGEPLMPHSTRGSLPGRSLVIRGR
jgi:hypothetical protein